MKNSALIILLALIMCTTASAGQKPSTPITGAATGESIQYPVSNGDVWTTTWADDDNMYTVSDDTGGIEGSCSGNLVISKITNADPKNIKGVLVNPMQEYGTAGQHHGDLSWKANGFTCIDSVLYLSVSRHMYGTGDFPRHSQTAQHASIIKSTDHGLTWTRSAQENIDNPMFPGRRFGAPYFVEYGKDYKVKDAKGNWVLPPHGGDKYVYAVSNDGYWDNGNNMILGRVRRDKIGDLKASDWQFYKGGDGMKNANWTKDMNQAVLILDDPEKVSMCAVQYIAPLNRYVMLNWYWVFVKGGGTPTAVWDLYESPTPWGPWKKFYSRDYNHPETFYNPCIAPKSISDDGREMVILTGADCWTCSRYFLHAIPLTLSIDKPKENSVQYVSTDNTTQGNWKGVYGQDGYDILGSTRSLPSYVTSLTYSSSPVPEPTRMTWEATADKLNALQKPDSETERIAVGNCSERQYIDITVSGDTARDVAIYTCDYDAKARILKVEAIDGDTGLVLDTHGVSNSNYQNGNWLRYKVKGHIKFRLININIVEGANAVYQGVFFGCK